MSGCARISSKGINGKNISIDGTVLLTLLYTDKEGNLCSYEYQYPFNKNIEMPEAQGSLNLCCKARTEYINCRAVTGRKVDIHGAVGIYLRVFKRKTTDIISDIDDCNIELHRSIAPATVPMGYTEKYLLVEEELAIGQGQCPIRNIVRSDVKSCVKETKVINDKAVVKGELSVCVLYCPDDGGNPQTVKTVIPFSQIVEIDGITDTCSCDTKSEVAFFEVKPRINSGGEAKTLSLTAKILLTAQATCSNEVPVVLDAFSRKFQAEMSRNRVCFEKIINNISETYHCKKAIELENSVESVLDLWCNVGTVTTKFENDNMIVCGEVIASMIAVSDKNNTFYCEKIIEFEYKYPISSDYKDAVCEPEIEILSCGYTLTSPENMELRIDLGVNAAVYDRNEMSLISDFAVDETRPMTRKQKGAMIIYFADVNENIWDVAKNYNASVEEIKRINELEGEEIPEGKLILVPMI